MRWEPIGGLVVVFMLACNGSAGQGGDESGGTGSGTSGTGTTGTSATGTGTGTSTSTSTTSDKDTDPDTGETGKLDLPVECTECGNKVYACADGIDNDDDGKTDMADPECLSPCNDDEGAFFHGIPTGNWDCGMDCMVDANWGQGDDGCKSSAVCQPVIPEGLGCAFDPNFSVCDDPIDPQCLATCLPSVPPGCDCFGCCEVDTGDGKITVQTGLPDDDCRLDNLDGCVSCVQNEGCLRPCDAQNCEWCFGDTNPAPNCEEISCPDDAQSCSVDAMGNDDCPPCQHCLLGCCTPTPQW